MVDDQLGNYPIKYIQEYYRESGLTDQYDGMTDRFENCSSDPIPGSYALLTEGVD